MVEYDVLSQNADCLKTLGRWHQNDDQLTIYGIHSSDSLKTQCGNDLQMVITIYGIH